MDTRTLNAHDAAIADKQNLIGMIATFVGLTVTAFLVTTSTTHWWEIITATYVANVGLVLWGRASKAYRGWPASHRVLPANATAGFISLGIAVVAFIFCLVFKASHVGAGVEITITITLLGAVTAAYELCFSPTSDEQKAAATPAPADTPAER